MSKGDRIFERVMKCSLPFKGVYEGKKGQKSRFAMEDIAGGLHNKPSSRNAWLVWATTPGQLTISTTFLWTSRSWQVPTIR